MKCFLLIERTGVIAIMECKRAAMWDGSEWTSGRSALLRKTKLRYFFFLAFEFSFSGRGEDLSCVLKRAAKMRLRLQLPVSAT